MPREHFARFIFAALIGAAVFASGVSAEAQTYTDLHDFNASAGDPTNFNSGRLAQARDGNFYAESRAGGSSGQGAAFNVSPGGAVSIIFSFDGTTGSGATGGMTLGPSDGELYGDAQYGGTSGDGVTFKVTTSGTYTPLHNFTNTGDGENPVNALVVGSNGAFYGLTDSNPETFYSVTSAGKLTTLQTFTTAQGYQGGQLTLGSDGDYYGGMNLGGANGTGTLLKVTPSGRVTVLHSFVANASDGTDAAGGMVEAPNGLFFGTPYAGGANGAGTLFKITSSGTFTLLRSFAAATDGSGPEVLMLGTDGNMYGVTMSGGTNNCGTLFKVTQEGVFSVVYNFASATGCNPEGYLTQATDGELYGLTNNGGAHGNGTFFSLDLGIAPFAVLSSTSGDVGSKIGILGMGFSSSSVVKFNGVTATSTLTDAGYITATVPAGATNGYVTVTTGTTTLTSTQTFTVHNSWASGAALPIAVAGPAAGAISGKIYVVAGVETSGGAPVNNNQVYNPSSNSWTTAAVIPTPVYAAASAVVNGLLYVIGGYEGTSGTPSNLVQIYSPKTNAWTTGATMPTARGSVAAAVDGTSIYVIGGNGSTNRLTNVEKYVPSTNTWTEEAPLLTGVSEPSAGLLGSTIVAADGYTTSGDLGTNEGYDVSTNAWSALTSDPNPRNGACYGVISGLLYVASGLFANPSVTEPLTVNESFDAKSDNWRSLAVIPAATFLPGSVVNNGQLYCFGGFASYQGVVIDNVQIYQP
jgi:uncharacterized repeat protein (TIGR03803 family)